MICCIHIIKGVEKDGPYKYGKKNIAPYFLTTACLYIKRVKLGIIVLPVFCKFVADLLQIL